MNKSEIAEAKYFSVQLVRDVLQSDGTNSVRRTENVTAQIKWDTDDGNPPKLNSYATAGEWRILE